MESKKFELPIGKMNKLCMPGKPLFYEDEIDDSYEACEYCGDPITYKHQCCSECHYETIYVIGNEHYRAAEIIIEKGSRALTREQLAEVYAEDEYEKAAGK